jgi:cyclic pyranopterin phosphate synthase
MSGTPGNDVTGGLTHIDESGAARMVDVSAKDVSVRTATATARVEASAEVLDLLRAGVLPKGDALGVARVAGIMAAKRTPDLIPLCHPIALHGVTVDVEVGGAAIEISATARTADRTGVEMEALTAATVAGLTMIDMVKGVDPAARIVAVEVVEKTGGVHGDWHRTT